MYIVSEEAEVARKPVAEPVAPVAIRRHELEYVRFRPLHRALHACMIVSFITLALTGLSLKFSYTGWASRLSHLFGGFQTAGFIHRSAAFLMFTAFITHVVDLVRTKRIQKQSWREVLFGENSMLPMRQDLRDNADEFAALARLVPEDSPPITPLRVLDVVVWTSSLV